VGQPHSWLRSSSERSCWASCANSLVVSSSPPVSKPCTSALRIEKARWATSSSGRDRMPSENNSFMRDEDGALSSGRPACVAICLSRASTDTHIPFAGTCVEDQYRVASRLTNSFHSRRRSRRRVCCETGRLLMRNSKGCITHTLSPSYGGNSSTYYVPPKAWNALKPLCPPCPVNPALCQSARRDSAANPQGSRSHVRCG